MADVELIVEAGVDAEGTGVPDLRAKLSERGARVLGPAPGSGPPGGDVTVVVADLEHAAEVLARHTGRSRALVVVQGAHFPFVRPALQPDGAGSERGAGVVFCVWGFAARDELARRFPDARVVVTGLPRRDDGLRLRMPHASPPQLDRDGEVVLLGPGAGAPLPPALGAVAERLETLLGTRPRRITAAELRRLDRILPALAVGSPADSLTAVAAGVPLIVLDAEERRLPPIQHHLLASADSTDRAEELVLASLATGRFWGNSAGDLLEWFIAGADGPEATVRAILDAAGASAADRDVISADPDERGRGERWDAGITVVGANFGRDVGLAIPVMTLAGSLTVSGRCPVRYVDARAFATERQYRVWIPAGDTLLVNGLETLTAAPALRRFAQSRLDSGDPAFVYIHLTEAGLERERSRRPGELEAALRLLRRCTVLCVSEYQERLFRGLGVQDTIVVYNTSPSLAGAVGAPAGTRPLPPDPRIVMVGTVQERKGVDLFSRVADLAAERHPGWRFEWAGAPAGTLPPGIHRSERVEWLGRLGRDEIGDLLRRSDLFFLSSRDDPMPLAVIEAVGAGLRVVSSDRVGAFEILRGAAGYAAFSESTAEAALAAIEAALAADPDPTRWREVRARFTIEAFTDRMRTALGIGLGAAGEPAPLRRAPGEPPPAFPVPAETVADPAASTAARAVLLRAAERHATDRAARLRLADRLLAAGDPRSARDVLAGAGVRRVPARPDEQALTEVLRRESARPGRLLRSASALRRRSLSWARRLRRLAARR